MIRVASSRILGTRNDVGNQSDPLLGGVGVGVKMLEIVERVASSR